NKGSADSIKFEECPVDPEKAVMGRWNIADLTGIYPFYINSSFASAMLEFDRIIDGFARVNPLIAGVEARSSSPVKILRNAEFESAVKGIFPCGEGAGYAGGIVSAAIDGMKVAEKIITN
ncbi:MAG: FAD-dependent oxidoreductase, partial [Lachnospiraceae bacterium]|nr:FAD-dependent oxidoreductase [Lachnospiraceae bacterium]